MGRLAKQDDERRLRLLRPRMPTMKRILLLGFVMLCQSCHPSDGAPSGVVDDTTAVTQLKLHPRGAVKAYSGLATASPSHVIASSWRRMKDLIDKSPTESKTFNGFRVVHVPGFGASEALLPDSYSGSYSWVIICDGSTLHQSGGDCAIKGNSGRWIAEVPISTDDIGAFPAIVESIKAALPSN